MKTKNALLTGSIAVSLFLASCGGGSDEAQMDFQETTDTLSADVRADLTLIGGSIPPPHELSNVLSKAKYNYNKDMMNPTSKASSYSTKTQQATNLGGYGACLGYATAYNQSQDIVEYMAQIAKLAKAVGIDSAFDEEFIKSITANIGKEDTINQLISKAFSKAERNLRSHDRVSVTAQVAAGGWVESLYIAAGIIGSKDRDDSNAEAYNKVSSHVYTLPYVIDFLKQYSSTNPDCAALEKELTALRPILDATVKSSSFGKPEVLKIKETIAPLRNKLTS